MRIYSHWKVKDDHLEFLRRIECEKRPIIRKDIGRLKQMEINERKSLKVGELIIAIIFALGYKGIILMILGLAFFSPNILFNAALWGLLKP